MVAFKVEFYYFKRVLYDFPQTVVVSISISPSNLEPILVNIHIRTYINLRSATFCDIFLFQIFKSRAHLIPLNVVIYNYHAIIDEIGVAKSRKEGEIMAIVNPLILVRLVLF